MGIEIIWWEATYGDGTTVSETRGAEYKNLDRTNLKSFLLRDNESPIVELTPDGSRTGHNLAYRRRVVSIDGFQPETVYVLGWVPQGPIFAVAPESNEVWESADWIMGDPVFYPPLPHVFERWTPGARTQIVNPAYERID